jgi:hypothetical protein
MKSPDKAISIRLSLHGDDVNLIVQPDQWNRSGDCVSAVLPCVETTTGQVVVSLASSSRSDLLQTLVSLELDGNYALFATESEFGNLLVSESIGTQTLQQFESSLSFEKDNIAKSAEQIANATGIVIQSLINIVPELCERGWFYADLSPVNIACNPDLGAALLNLAGCCRVGDSLMPGADHFSLAVHAANKILRPPTAWGRAWHYFDRGATASAVLATPARAQAALMACSMYLLMRCHLHLQSRSEELRSVQMPEAINWNPFQMLLGMDSEKLQRYLGLQKSRVLDGRVQRWLRSVRSSDAGDWKTCLELINSVTRSVTGYDSGPLLGRVSEHWLRRVSEIGTTASATVESVLAQWPERLGRYRDQLPKTKYADAFGAYDELSEGLVARQYLEFWLDRFDQADATSVERELCVDRICSRDGLAEQERLYSDCRQTPFVQERCRRVQDWSTMLRTVQNAVACATEMFRHGPVREGIQHLRRHAFYSRDYLFLHDLLNEGNLALLGAKQLDLLAVLADARRNRRFCSIQLILSREAGQIMAPALLQEAQDVMDRHFDVIKRGRELLRAGDLVSASQKFAYAMGLVADSTAADLGQQHCRLRKLLKNASFD